MPRGPRIDFPGAAHHVYARGIEKRDIYSDDDDRSVFLNRLGFNLDRWNMRCFAWTLMPNHFHLLVQSDTGTLSTFMHCLLSGYSQYFNKRHNRVGHLFQNRYKSPLIVNAGHFRDVVRYIHMNPVRSGIVPSIDNLGEYPWTGHRRIVRSDQPEWQNIELLQTEFGKLGKEATWIRHYCDFLGTMKYDSTENVFPDNETEAMEHEKTFHVDDPSGLHQVFTKHLHRLANLHGISTEHVLSNNKNYMAVQVRKAVLEKCRSEMDVPISQLARWIGMKENAARYLLNYSR
jgi:REP element-mobilizing transposase RayT